MKICPKCSGENPSDAWLCNCGYEFNGTSVESIVEPKVSSTNEKPTTKYPTWRWIFILLLTSNVAAAASLVVSMIQYQLGYVSENLHPTLVLIIIMTMFWTMVFLLFVSPFFFRRIGFLPIVSWIIALAEMVFLHFAIRPLS